MFFQKKFDKTMDQVKEDLMHQKDVLLLDVRTKEEFCEGHLKGAVNIPLDDLNEIKINKDQTLYVMCRSGQRSASAIRRLSAMGYHKLYNIGGIIHWNGEVIKGEE